MDLENTRTLEAIATNVIKARQHKVGLVWKPDELAVDMLTVIQALELDIKKYLAKGMEAPAKRIRANTKLLETLGKSFRVQSVK